MQKRKEVSFFISSKHLLELIRVSESATPYRVKENDVHFAYKESLKYEKSRVRVDLKLGLTKVALLSYIP